LASPAGSGSGESPCVRVHEATLAASASGPPLSGSAATGGARLNIEILGRPDESPSAYPKSGKREWRPFLAGPAGQIGDADRDPGWDGRGGRLSITILRKVADAIRPTWWLGAHLELATILVALSPRHFCELGGGRFLPIEQIDSELLRTARNAPRPRSTLSPGVQGRGVRPAVSDAGITTSPVSGFSRRLPRGRSPLDLESPTNRCLLRCGQPGLMGLRCSGPPGATPVPSTPDRGRTTSRDLREIEYWRQTSGSFRFWIFAMAAAPGVPRLC